jgi:hypothetical protein
VAVRAAVGLMETAAVTVIAACAVWNLFPALRASTAPADFAPVLLTTLVWLAGPYCATLLFETLLAEPFSMVIAGWAFCCSVALAYIAPLVDVVPTFGQASPLITHRLPWPQIATSASVSLILFVAAVRIVQTREY